MIEQYKFQPVVPADWPPRIGEDFFGRLALLEVEDRYTTFKAFQDKQQLMLRGEVDKIPRVTHDKIIDTQDILKPCDSGQSLRVVVDGPPGIGKTTLCRKLLKMWANGELIHGKYDVVLYCPLRDNRVAQASTLADLSVYQSPKISKAIEWMTDTDGEELLLIIDGWDELSTELRQSSLAARIIFRKILSKCSVLVTSRSYSSSSLLRIPSVNRHVEVMGFTQKEIQTVVKRSLEKEPRLAEKLIKDLEVRVDVRSLCYVPLVCSLVISVCQIYGQLPATFTKLYENFILQTIRRHLKVTTSHNIEPDEIGSLNHLSPPEIAKSFQEMCQFAYINMKGQDNPRMTFTLPQLKESLHQSVKENYLGLMTTFTLCGERSYQFLHLTIQEFLAAWWIAKYEKSEDIFVEHFHNDHFRMCLRFVAGLTQLEHVSYQQCFNNQLDLQCKRRPLFGFQINYCYQELEFAKPHLGKCPLTGKFDFFLFHLLYESQNTKLCEILSHNITNQSLCLHKRYLPLFDILCLSYFLHNSKIIWKYLDLGELNRQAVQLFINMKSVSECIGLEIKIEEVNFESVKAMLQSSLYLNLQECFLTLKQMSANDFSVVLLQLIKLKQIRILNYTIGLISTASDYCGKHVEILSELTTNITLTNLAIMIENDMSDKVNTAHIVNSVIEGVSKNRSILLFSISWRISSQPKQPVLINAIESLLKDNQTLKALKLDIRDQFLPSFTFEVNTPLTALELVGSGTSKLKMLLRCFKELDCLILQSLFPIYKNDFYHVNDFLMHSHHSLQQLKLLVDINNSILFTYMQQNKTIKNLSIRFFLSFEYGFNFFHIGNKHFEDFLIRNKTIECLEIDTDDYCCSIDDAYMPLLNKGLSQNTSLQGLSVPILLSDRNYEQRKNFFDIISCRKINELKVQFRQPHHFSSESFDYRGHKTTELFHEEVLPNITNMLRSHSTIRLLHIKSLYIVTLSNPPSNWVTSAQDLWKTIFSHPSIKYFGISKSSVLEDTLKSQEKALIEIHKQLQPPRPLPIIEWIFAID